MTTTRRQRSSCQLNRLLENTHFSHSKRFPSFLRFIVQEEMEGRGDQLKERTLGVEVFGRDATYDTNADPIVRVTAAEIRKRIAQYYQEAREDELRISLPAGSYVPHFEWPSVQGQGKLPTASQTVSVATPSTKGDFGESNPSARATRRRRDGFYVAAATAILALVIYLLVPQPTTLDRFWAPMFSSGEPVVVCFPESRIDGISLRSAADPSVQRHFDEQANGVIVDDLQPLVSLSGLLEMRHQRYVLRGENTATLTDLREGPAIFLGAFDNAWTLRITRSLRFRFGVDETMTHFWIEDTHSSTGVRWSIDRNQQEATNNYRDYAIVARFRDPTTGKTAIVAAGIARGGTVAAGEFLTQSANMDAIKSLAPRGWQGQNMEFVLSTEIIDGRSAAPKIEATWFW